MRKILLIGETCIDTFVYGNCDRLNPEAPTPIFQPNKSVGSPGMAANVKRNIQGFGFEVSTEESIHRFETEEIEHLLKTLRNKLSEDIFNKITYCVIQSGTSLSLGNNTGVYSSNRLEDMIRVVKSYDLLSKEHKGDFLSKNLVSDKFKLGLDCINIAPEFGTIETEAILKRLNDEEIQSFYNLCYESNKWIKWVPSDFNPDENKLQIIKISGHYVFSHPKFIKIKESIIGIDEEIKTQLKRKISELL